MSAFLSLALVSVLLVADPQPVGAVAKPAAAEPATPISFKQVVEIFTRMTEVRPTRVHERCVVFSLGQAYKRNDHVESIIVVTEDPPRLGVSFLISGGYGMNFVSEFFEAPFFARNESEEFYRLLNAPQGHSGARFSRYSVDFSRIETPEWHFISLSFGPTRALEQPRD